MNPFRDLHVPGTPVLMPNAWDAGSAALLSAIGFQAIGSTSAGAAFAAGRAEGTLTLDEMLDSAETVATASGLPVSADLENGGGGSVEDARNAILAAASRGLPGASIEDWGPDGVTYPMDVSVARIEAAVDAAREKDIVLTARAEGLLGPSPDMADICKRLAAFARAGADVVFAPGLKDAEMVREVVAAANGTPVSVILGAPYGAMTVSDLAGLGVARISLGSSLARAAYGCALSSARNLLETGRFSLPEETLSFGAIESLLRR